LSLIFGAKLVLGVSIFLGSIFTLASPFAAYFDYKLLMALRLMIGLSQVTTFQAWSIFKLINDFKEKIFKGCLSSSVNVVFAAWVPPAERSTLVSGKKLIFFLTKGY
jgi:MFS family permease